MQKNKIFLVFRGSQLGFRLTTEIFTQNRISKWLTDRILVLTGSDELFSTSAKTVNVGLSCVVLQLDKLMIVIDMTTRKLLEIDLFKAWLEIYLFKAWLEMLATTQKIMRSSNTQLSIAKCLNSTFFFTLELILTWETCKLLKIYSIKTQLYQSSIRSNLYSIELELNLSSTRNDNESSRDSWNSNSTRIIYISK